MAQKSGRMNFETVLQALRDDPASVFTKYGRMLSDLQTERLAALRKVLADLSPEKRAVFYHEMNVSSEESFEYNYAPIALIGLSDEDGDIRADSVAVLGYEDSRGIAAQILKAAQNDPCDKVRVEAIGILGQYMLEEAEGGRIPVSKNHLHDTFAELIENHSPAVRRAAVQAYAVSETKRVKEIISGYFAGNDRDELITALRASRIALSEDMDTQVLELIDHEDEDIRIEAINTAGELQLREALPVLYDTISGFDRISPDLLIAAAEAVANIGDEEGLDVLETLGEAAVDMDEEITEAIDNAIDALNMSIGIDPAFSFHRGKHKKMSAVMLDAIEKAKDRCLTILEEKIPRDLEDDEPIDEDDGCECGEEHHHHHHHNPLEGLDISRFRILDDLEAYESAADRDEDEEDLWAEFEDMAEEDLDADSLQDFISKLEKQKAKKQAAAPSASKKKSGKNTRK